MKKIEYFFDFLSPYAYLSHCRLPAIAAKYGCEIVYRPIDLKAAKLAAGNTAPPTAAIPPKLRYAVADLTRWAKRYGAPFSMAGGPPQSERANKGTFFAIERGQGAEYVTKLWLATFGSGGGMNDDAILGEVARQLGWSPEAFLDFVKSDAAERLYAAGNQDAQSRGVFGVPTMVIDDQMWWGNDRLDFVEEYLAAHAER